MSAIEILVGVTTGALQLLRAALAEVDPSQLDAFKLQMLHELRETEKAWLDVAQRQTDRQAALDDAVPRK